MRKDVCRDFIQSSAAATVKPKQAQLRLIAWLHERTKGWTTGSRRHENRDMKRVDGRGQGHSISFNAPCTGQRGLVGQSMVEPQELVGDFWPSDLQMLFARFSAPFASC